MFGIAASPTSFFYADKQKIPFCVVVGSIERESATVVLKQMHNREQHPLAVDAAAQHIHAYRSNHE
ncbi:His/Gly/Thr/Pro-type tRNA ligase C-terminal domain-containing protein [Neosynechococcus sphagnicola]|uniref:His/Gly/Thr/Pro-type tRNA ligase C-terminal domain-containing protein n=1 Tax=Neosynechococcus sphagnicola TaxID=1501145 RepID=UPI0006911F37|nr:His/Gly/Thr/Pro-type tRNA ligase C-terminal domain-containing protein [Neosynechococcus sphagnicola]